MKVMFICTGNICRSAMAEGILKKMMEEEIEVYSAGIEAMDGDGATFSAIEAAKFYDVDITSHKATNIKKSAIAEMNVILCATKLHKEMILYLYPKLQGKVFTMKEYVGLDKEGQDLDIKDPWGYDRETYKECCAEIYRCCEKIGEKIE